AGVGERVEVGGRDAVVVDAVVVRREAALAPGMRPHEVVRRQRIVRAGVLWERPAERDAAPGADQSGRSRALGRCDEIDGAELIVLAPAAPVASIAIQPCTSCSVGSLRSGIRGLPGECCLRRAMVSSVAGEPGATFFALTPDRVLDAVEVGGLRCTGRCLPLRAFENRVYEVELEDERRLVVKFYRPGRWSRDTILDEHAFL